VRVALWWLRRDLRVGDQPALQQIRSEFDQVGLVVVRDPSVRGISPRRTEFFDAAVESLATVQEVTILEGTPSEALPDEARRIGATEVFACEEPTPRGNDRDKRVAQALDDLGVPFTTSGSPDAVPPGTVRAKSGEPYKMFSPFHRVWSTHPSTTSRASASPHQMEADALGQLTAYLSDHPDLDRDHEHLDGRDRSRLGPAIRFGLVSAERVRSQALAVGHEAWVRQLAWRDFSYECIRRWPELLTRSIRERDWSSDDEAFEQWCKGTTGCDPVDAGMRQLARTGYISNRVRMLVASFLTKDLGIHWLRGADWFMRQLLDGDPAVNATNWQWVASTGFDAMPPYRRLSPERQAERFDPDGTWTAHQLAGGPTL
jgi:deoxyribodipyrimidine photo-lyase